MDLFCNDKYWKKMEDTSKMIPQILKPEYQRRRAQHVCDQESLPPNQVRQWGECNYRFRFQAQGMTQDLEHYQMTKNATGSKSLFNASILNAEAEEPNNPGFKVPIKCSWFRQKNGICQKIPEISSNVYQLSAKDLGCVIKVEAEPMDPDFQGRAFGEFGPVQLDIAARQHLEQILGAGGSQNSVSVIMNDGGSSFEVKEECQDATLYINSNVLKISLKQQNLPQSQKHAMRDQNTIAFKYTVGYPKIELHPFDTRKLSILFNDSQDSQGTYGSAGQMIEPYLVNLNPNKQDSKANHFEKKLDLRCLSRESRDLICLTIRSFAAQSYFINTKIINLVEDQTQCDMIVKNSKYPSDTFNQNRSRRQDIGELVNNQYQLSDVLLELEFTKHDLNTQTTKIKYQEDETGRYKKQFNELEEEMQCTIESYKNIISQLQDGDSSNLGKFKQEIENMQKEIQSLESQRNKLIQNEKIKEDERQSHLAQIKQLYTKNDQLNENLENVQQQMGVPKIQYEQLKKQFKNMQQDNQQLNQELIDRREFMQSKEGLIISLEQQVKEQKQKLVDKQEYLEGKEEEVVRLRNRVKELEFNEQNNAAQMDMEQHQELQKEMDAVKRENKDLLDQNEALLTQRKSLQKAREALQKDLSKILKERETIKEGHLKEMEELQQKNEQEMEEMTKQMDTLRQANDRLQRNIGEYQQATDQLEIQQHLVQGKYDDIMKTRQQMQPKSCQTTPHEHLHNQSSQTKILVKYDQQQQANLEDPNEQPKQIVTQECAGQCKFNQQSTMQLQYLSAQTAEQESTIEQLKSVIQNKDTLVSDLQMQMAKLMERLSNAEQKLFEMQDSMSNISNSSFVER